ncbi:MAG: Fatty acid desaturase [uncultured bacterium]|nr:MAG: Fatty acid desaturase [uncultured bacterium]OGT16169.1 MAG: hypothetical protein A3B69_00695 [Gammaproteobacteria bacterium RIFCSPHIGHO2_02_FULL_38_33]OGT69586.1 MAG: hypothetical protein A3I12_03025 [Gammaproteobacteria bacterium RIFCSPLOWO2_02_FULL_38_11]OGT75432.1 MAG: hypothetical protein A3G71_06280 [Gammaproteobacteria bacterium RIFCSPLOWO2_12_FULL_38_14]
MSTQAYVAEKRYIVSKIKNGPYIETNNHSNLIYILFDYLLVMISITLSLHYKNPIVYVSSVIVISSRMRALENLLHDASHRKLFKNPFLNTWIGMLCCAFPVFNSLYAYKISHDKHHRYLGDSVSDPDRVRYDALGMKDALKTPGAFIKKIISIMSLIEMPKFLLGTIKPFIFNRNTPKKEIIARVIFYISLFFILTYFSVWKYFIFYWVFPYLTAFQLIRFLSEVSEHGNLYQNTHSIYKISRNNLCHPVLAFFLYPHSDNLHLLHHLLPHIPHYFLPQLHHELMSDAIYAQGNHCYGYLFRRNKNTATTISDLLSLRNKGNLC